jgi:hypothetical protein
MDGAAFGWNQECPEEKNSGVIEMRSVLSKLGCSFKLFVGANLTARCTRHGFAALVSSTRYTDR